MLHCDYCQKEVDYDDGPIVEIRVIYHIKDTIIKLAHYNCWRGVDKIGELDVS